MNDELYVSEAEVSRPGDQTTTEFEPIFDAAEFMHFGKDNLHTTKWGYELHWHSIDATKHWRWPPDPHSWLQAGPNTMKLDANFVPMAPRKIFAQPSQILHTSPAPFHLHLQGWIVIPHDPTWPSQAMAQIYAPTIQLHSKFRSITSMAIKVHVILWSFVVLTWMRNTIELV